MSFRSCTSLAALVLGSSFLGACAHRPAPVATPAPATESTAEAAAPAPEEPSGTLASRTMTDQEVQQALDETVLHFGFDEARLTEESLQKLQRVAEVLGTRTDVRIRIEGHCDERGTQEYNMALGQRRAEAAKQELAQLGVSSDRIATISWGLNRPVATGHDEQAWAMNRRDEIKTHNDG